MTIVYHINLLKIKDKMKILKSNHSEKKTLYWDFPGGPVVKNSPYNARDTGSNASKQLSPGVTTKTQHSQIN